MDVLFIPSLSLSLGPVLKDGRGEKQQKAHFKILADKKEESMLTQLEMAPMFSATRRWVFINKVS